LDLKGLTNDQLKNMLPPEVKEGRVTEGVGHGIYDVGPQMD